VIDVMERLVSFVMICLDSSKCVDWLVRGAGVKRFRVAVKIYCVVSRDTHCVILYCVCAKYCSLRTVPVLELLNSTSL
jgi:hypothetical protein